MVHTQHHSDRIVSQMIGVYLRDTFPHTPQFHISLSCIQKKKASVVFVPFNTFSSSQKNFPPLAVFARYVKLDAC